MPPQKEKVDPDKRDKQDKGKAINLLVSQLEKEHGKGIIMKLGDQKKEKIPFIPTGAITLDMAIGIGGVPKGRVVEIFGPESSGKTTLTLHIIAESQKNGGVCAFIDAEHALDPSYAKLIGVDVENLYISQPDSGDQALDIAETLVRSCTMDVIIIDSVAALVPKTEIEGQMGDAVMGAQARLMSQALRKLTPLVNKSSTTVIFINQIRQKIGVMFGSPETTTGGNALKFYASLRLDIRKTENLKKGDNFYGSHVKVKVVKNKIAPPFKIAEFDIYYSEGINKESSILEAAVQHEMIKKSGTWYSYGEERIGQGKDNSIQYLKEHPEITTLLENKLRQMILDENESKNDKKDSKKEASKTETTKTETANEKKTKKSDTEDKTKKK